MLEIGNKIRLNPKVNETEHCNYKIENIIRKHNLIGIIKNRITDFNYIYHIDFYTNNQDVFDREWERMINSSNFVFDEIEKDELKYVTKNYTIINEEELKPVNNKIKKL